MSDLIKLSLCLCVAEYSGVWAVVAGAAVVGNLPSLSPSRPGLWVLAEEESLLCVFLHFQKINLLIDS